MAESILPKSALQVQEEAWNAYPYTKTRYKCPFIEKFLLEVETRYTNDGGDQENMFNLTATEKRNRILDFIDIVKDPISSGDFNKEEDPKTFVSDKTNRGPLLDNWREEYSIANKDPNSGKKIMTAYKLCKVEFKYWGMQSRIERFIHDIGLRKTMLRAHRQAWCWQDEYYGLSLQDIRRLEAETQEALKEKYKTNNPDEINNELNEQTTGGLKKILPVKEDTVDQKSPQILHHAASEDQNEADGNIGGVSRVGSGRRAAWGSSKSKSATSRKSARDWRVESMEQLVQDDSSGEEEFFDAFEVLEEEPDDHSNPSMYRSSSMDIIPQPDDRDTSAVEADEVFSSTNEKQEDKLSGSDQGGEGSPVNMQPSNCKTTVLFLVLHGGSVLETSSHEHQSHKHNDISILKSTLDHVIRAYYPSIHNRIAVRLVSCPPICSETLRVLSSLSPYGFDAQSPDAMDNSFAKRSDFIPIGALALFATNSPEYHDIVTTVISRANYVYSDFLKSEEGLGFNGQVCLIGDSTGSVIGYDALCRCYYSNSSRASSRENLPQDIENDTSIFHKKSNLETIKQLSFSNPDLLSQSPTESLEEKQKRCSDSEPRDMENDLLKRPPVTVRHLSLPCSRRTSSSSQPDFGARLEFDVSDYFMFGSPLAMVLAFRKMHLGEDKSVPPLRPSCHQLYNLFHATDPSVARLEPLLVSKFAKTAPIKVCRYQRFPLGDGQSTHVVTDRWWGNKRLDYALYCPDALHNFPVASLPHLFHASYWESTDVIAFMLRQVVRQDAIDSQGEEPSQEVSLFTPTQPREKWLRRRTTIKLRNVAPNHRANDVIVLEDKPQVLVARFMYGPLDMVSLTGEKVDIHIVTRPPDGDWVYFGTEVTDSNGRVTFTVPVDKQLPQGMYPVKIVVRGDHTSVDFYMSVLPPLTESVVFSIDGSFTASVSIMGKDPKVRAGAVDIVRHWQELGFLIIYITARPDMQHKRVVAWLAQHNFPHGMVSFMDGLSVDPLRQKADYMKSLIKEAKITIHAAYGSSKDISVYQAVGMNPSGIYIVGKASKKQYTQAQVLEDGYAAHLEQLTSHGGSRAAVGNARLFLRKQCFGLPGQKRKSIRKRSVKKTTSLPPGGGPIHSMSREQSLSTKRRKSPSRPPSYSECVTTPSIGVSESGKTYLDVGTAGTGKASRSRGSSPRPKLSPFRYESQV
ncbi:unnamed protein product [Owenia fusiformis]|uniref:DDHD domain-containing protein n=1 Tax=Owenia fusiformis TaxID=6347 RepID=A0A8S4Q3B9_OWEFU|nr:unnamed protein product [Owenia fusiformis]